jgi:choline transport protein
VRTIQRVLTIFDSDSHLAEEITNPQRNVPIAIGLQMAIGFVTGLLYIIAIMVSGTAATRWHLILTSLQYAINDFDALFESSFPIAEIYLQATGSSAGTIGLLCLLLFCIMVCTIGVYITAGRTLWTLGRDKATPFPNFVSAVSPKLGMPFNATIICACVVTILGW